MTESTASPHSSAAPNGSAWPVWLAEQRRVFKKYGHLTVLESLLLMERMEKALRAAEGHLAEQLPDKRWHPIGHCPVLDEIRYVLASASEHPQEDKSP